MFKDVKIIKCTKRNSQGIFYEKKWSKEPAKGEESDDFLKCEYNHPQLAKKSSLPV